MLKSKNISLKKYSPNQTDSPGNTSVLIKFKEMNCKLRFFSMQIKR